MRHGLKGQLEVQTGPNKAPVSARAPGPNMAERLLHFERRLIFAASAFLLWLVQHLTCATTLFLPRYDMRITMVGTGYVGLASGTCFADFGHHVTCVDNNGDKIAALRRGLIPIFEPDLDRLVETNSRAGRLVFSTDLTVAVRHSDAVFIAVGTPSRRGDGHADLSYVCGAARDIAPELNKFTVVITKSTVPVGTGDEVERVIRDTNPSADLAIASNPEFLREGLGNSGLQAS